MAFVQYLFAFAFNIGTPATPEKNAFWLLCEFAPINDISALKDDSV